MDSTQNFTQDIKEIDKAIKTANPKPLTQQQQAWIDFKAIGGYLTDPDATVPKKMTVTEFAEKLGVERRTLYDWQRNIPNFWEQVSERRTKLFSQERLTKIHDVWYLKALSGSFPHLQLWLANFDPNFKMPAQKHELEAGSTIAELLGAARQRNVIEGEVVDGTTSDNA